MLGSSLLSSKKCFQTQDKPFLLFFRSCFYFLVGAFFIHPLLKIQRTRHIHWIRPTLFLAIMWPQTACLFHTQFTVPKTFQSETEGKHGGETVQANPGQKGSWMIKCQSMYFRRASQNESEHHPTSWRRPRLDAFIRPLQSLLVSEQVKMLLCKLFLL